MTSVKSITLSKALIWAFIFSLFLALAYPVLAEESTSPARTHKAIVQNRMEAVREKIASREAALKAKLQTFRDQRKAALAEKINQTLAMINKKQTDQMKKHLDLMTTLLNKLQDRVDRGTPDIKDKDAALAAIADSRAKIASTSAAVTAQSLKDYTIVVTSETTVQADARAARDRLHTDLFALRKLVIDAKQSVANAIRVAHSGSNKEGTQSGQE